LAKGGEGGWGKNSCNKGGGEEGEGKEKGLTIRRRDWLAGGGIFWRHNKLMMAD